MSASHRRPVEAEARDDRETPATEAPDAAVQPLDWQVLLLRYLPQPLGAAHAIKRLSHR
jgi:hypothetical protein